LHDLLPEERGEIPNAFLQRLPERRVVEVAKSMR
jgi:hypothetical protein